MPASNLYTTKEYQSKLMYGIQDVIVRSFNKVNTSKSLFGILFALIDLIGVAYRLWRLGKPTHETVYLHNQHVLIDVRDWFLEHDRSKRRGFYEAFFNLLIMKYGFDWHMGRRLEKVLQKLYEFGWLDPDKHPETEWELNEEDKKEPTYQRQQALQKALDDEEWGKVLNLID